MEGYLCSRYNSHSQRGRTVNHGIFRDARVLQRAPRKGQEIVEKDDKGRQSAEILGCLKNRSQSVGPREPPVLETLSRNPLLRIKKREQGTRQFVTRDLRPGYHLMAIRIAQTAMLTTTHLRQYSHCRGIPAHCLSPR
jgi:hypothetical protein